MDELTIPKAPANMNPDAMFAALDSVAESTPGLGLSRSATPVSFPQPAPPAKLSVPYPLEFATVDTRDDAASPVEIRRPIPEATSQQRNPLLLPLVMLIVIAFVQAVLLVWGPRSAAVPPSSAGTVVVESTPAGATIAMNGKAMGKTPVTLTLDPGKYMMDITSGSITERVAVAVQAGITTAERFHFADTSVNAALQVSSQPLGARVSVDGTPRGVTPLTIADLQPGLHTVSVEGASGSTRESVKLLAGTTASLAVTLPSVPSGATGGWLTVTAPIDIQLFENGTLLGSSQSERIMLPAGRHVIDAVNTTLGYRTTHTVQIGAGAVSRVGLEMPPAVLSINAVPWAEVSVDGKSLGVTPLGNVSLPIGPHEIVFRHPQLGERRRTAIVTLTGPNRVSENLSQR
jgi:CRISPR/Cas system-associated exonuclease Cas4 (RecB family)